MEESLVTYPPFRLNCVLDAFPAKAAGLGCKEGRALMGESTKATAVVRRTWVLAAAVLGFALFLSAVWTARNETSLVPDVTLYAARFVKAVGCFALALALRRSITSVRKLFVGGAALTVAHIAAYAAMYALGSDTQEFQALSVLSGVFAGLGEVAVILLFAHLFSTYAPRLSAVLIPAGYLLNEIFYCSTLYMSSDMLLVLRPACKVLGIALLLWCLVQKSRTQLADDEYPMQHGMSTKVNVEPLSRFLSSGHDWVLILTSAMLFPLMFALVAQVNSSAGANSGLYDVMNEFFAIALIACLVWYGASRKARISFSDVLYLSLPLFATGCMLLPALWLAGNPLAGLLVKCGYTVNQVLFWVLLAHKSHDNLQHTYFYFGLFYGLYELFTAGGRLAMSWLYSTNGVTYEFVSNLSLFCLWLLAMYGLVFFALMRRHDAKRAGQGCTAGASAANAGVEASAFSAAEGVPVAEGESTAPDSKAVVDAASSAASPSGLAASAPAANAQAPQLLTPSAPPDPIPAVDGFAAQLERFCSQYELSAREREILVETIHGYSMENIGKRLYISRETVKTHLRHIYRKANVGGKQELLALIDDLR